jgi:3-hydroxymyristoyl/3-hydroxydecanoyl-(acyl carrier protein) dehydratase
VEDCKFRAQVLPGHRLYLMLQLEYVRHRRVRCKVQGMVEGALAFEAAIIGTEF